MLCFFLVVCLSQFNKKCVQKCNYCPHSCPWFIERQNTWQLSKNMMSKSSWNFSNERLFASVLRGNNLKSMGISSLLIRTIIFECGESRKEGWILMIWLNSDFKWLIFWSWPWGNSSNFINSPISCISLLPAQTIWI